MEEKIKVLWLCNFMPSFVAKALKVESTNKEGWIAGMAYKVIEKEDIDLAVAFPTNNDEIIKGKADMVWYYGFPEDQGSPENYDNRLENYLKEILEEFKPDVIHGFGTEYPHTLALLSNKEYAKKTLIHMQGLMEPYGQQYYTGLPMRVIKRATFRDVVRQDSIIKQKQKYLIRASYEKDALKLAYHVCGRTDFDKEYCLKINNKLQYHKLNETLRDCFYDESWNLENVSRHTIFISQGNYPLKGVHFALRALADIKKEYEDVHVYIAGDNVTKHSTFLEKLKLSSYGKYLLEIIDKNGLNENVEFVGQKTGQEMLELYKKSHVFLIPSVLENSPNSLGEAMLIGMPCVCARTGGIPSMINDSEGIIYDLQDILGLVAGIKELFSDDDKAVLLGNKAKERATVTHSQDKNYEDMLNIYRSIHEQ